MGDALVPQNTLSGKAVRRPLIGALESCDPRLESRQRQRFLLGSGFAMTERNPAYPIRHFSGLAHAGALAFVSGPGLDAAPVGARPCDR